jgi:hypothetical protein
LATHAYKAGDRWYGRVRLATYGAAPLPVEPTTPHDAGFGESIHLRGYGLPGKAFGPGNILPVTLFWEAQAPIAEPYKVTVQLLGDAGPPVAQHDSEPVAGFAPTTLWRPDQGVVDRHGIFLPTDLPSDEYTLVVAVYHAYTGERLSAVVDEESIGDHLVLTDIEVGR